MKGAPVDRKRPSPHPDRRGDGGIDTVRRAPRVPEVVRVIEDEGIIVRAVEVAVAGVDPVNDARARDAGDAQVLILACRVEEPVGGDGKRKARVRLACDRYPIMLDFALSEKDEKKVETIKFMPVVFRGGRCLQ